MTAWIRWVLPLALATSATACASRPAPSLPTPAGAGAQAVNALAKARARVALGVNTDGMKLMRRTGGQPMIKAALPARVDLRAGCSPVGDQGISESCFGFATADGLAEYVLREEGRFVDLSPRFVWNQTRLSEGHLAQNVAVNALAGVTVILDQGFATEKRFPTQFGSNAAAPAFMQQLLEAPPAEVLQSALAIRPFKGENFVATNTLPELKAMLAKGRPCLFFMKIHESSTRVGADGLWPLPSQDDPYLGDHAMLCVGYDDAKGRLLVRNSWGTRWGAQGYGQVPYEVIDRGMVVAGFTFAP